MILRPTRHSIVSHCEMSSKRKKPFTRTLKASLSSKYFLSNVDSSPDPISALMAYNRELYISINPYRYFHNNKCNDDIDGLLRNATYSITTVLHWYVLNSGVGIGVFVDDWPVLLNLIHKLGHSWIAVS